MEDAARDRVPAHRSLVLIALVSLAVLVALSTLVAHIARQDGQDGFVRTGDSSFFREVASAPFGNGDRFVAIGQPAEASYRYGRIGFPLTAWVLALGHPAWVPWSMVIINLLAIAAIPLLAGIYLAGLGCNPMLGALTLLAPGLMLVYNRPYAEPLALVLVLAAFIVGDREHRGWAIAFLACAMCTRETAIVAVVPFVWRDLRVRDTRVWQWALAFVPYAAWCIWVRVRVGEFPFAANVITRRDAVRAPFVGLKQGLDFHTADARLAVIAVAVTAALGIVAGWYARSILAGGAALAAGLFALCTGPSTLEYLGETLRVLSLPQVLVLVCIAFLVSPRVDAIADRLARARAET